MKKLILLLVVVAVIIFFVTRNNNDDVQNEAVNEDVTQDVSAVDSEDLEIKEDMSGVSGTYEAYSPEKLAFADEGNVVIFFRASWCPSCKALNEDIKDSLGNIPENLVILDADYDEETEMKQKYGVTTQHTLVQVDSEGTMIQKWSGGSTLESIIEKL